MNTSFPKSYQGRQMTERRTLFPATAIDADIATITGTTDKVIHVGGSPDWVLAVDFHSGHDAGQLRPRMLLYNAALGKRHQLRVRSLAVVLHPGADSPQLSGVYERGFPGEPADIMLRHRVLRVTPAELGDVGSPHGPIWEVPNLSVSQIYVMPALCNRGVSLYRDRAVA